MEFQLKNGDYLPDGTGGFAVCTGREALLARVLFLLTARRGAFPLLPDLGSRLYLLPRERPSARQALAGAYAAEALAGETDVQLTGVLWQEEAGTLTVFLTQNGEGLSVSLAIQEGGTQ